MLRRIVENVYSLFLLLGSVSCCLAATGGLIFVAVS